jgi:hypothetical protein
MRFWVFWSFFVDKRFIFFFKKDSRLGLLRLGFVAFLNQNFILISKTTRKRYQVTFFLNQNKILISKTTRKRYQVTFFACKRFIFFFEKDSRLGLLRLGFVAFLNQNFILISKTTCPRDRVAFAPCPVSR